MNTTFVRQSLGLAVTLMLFGGCARPSAQPDQPRTVVAPAPSQTVIVTPPAVPGGPSQSPTYEAPRNAVAQSAPAAPAGAPAGPAANDTNGPAIIQTVPPAEPANTAPGVEEVARLAQSGVTEEVMTTFVDRYPARFNVTAEQIVYLKDLGVSDNVLNSMLKHDGDTTTQLTSPSPTPAATAPAAGIPEQAISNVPQGQAAPPAPEAVPQAPAVATPPATPPPPSTEVTYFYDSLSPYGSWMYVAGYGWCWRPTVAVVSAGWRPYCDYGRWYWSDSGWYWHSDYSWGWAPFHYGRWYMHPRCGWIWTPGAVWGPAWVSWRYTDGFCGWAPLPPEAYWTPGVGFSYYGRHVSVGFEFGLGWHHYAFVSAGRFCDPYPYRHVVPRTQVVNIYRNTTVVNNYTYNNSTVINRGVGRDTIARQSQAPIRQVKVEPTSFAAAGARASKLERRGNDVVAFRPQLPKDPPVKPAVVQSKMMASMQQAQQAPVSRLDGKGSRYAAPGTATRVEPNAGSKLPGMTTPAPAGAPIRNGKAEARVQTPTTEPVARPTVPSRGFEPKSSPNVTAPNVTPRSVEPKASVPSHAAPAAPSRSAPAPSSGRNEKPHASVAPSTPTAPVAKAYETPVRTPAAPATVTPRATVQTPPAVPSAPKANYGAGSSTIPGHTPMPPSGSPRYTEQRVPSYSAPAHVPSYTPPAAPSYSRPEYSAPRSAPEPRASVPSVAKGGGDYTPRGGGGSGHDGGGAGRGGHPKQ